jgi:phospholipase C
MRVTDLWSLDGFDKSRYHVSICGPNGFLRELSGDASDPLIEVRCEYARGVSAAEPTGELNVVVTNKNLRDGYRLQITDHMYKGRNQSASLRPGEVKTIRLRLAKSFSWYDLTISLPEFQLFARRCAGRVETGRVSVSDPVMGRLE